MDAKDLLQTTDAQIWAQEFIKTMEENYWGPDDIDEGLMIGWFANAMAAMEMQMAAAEASQAKNKYDDFIYNILFHECGVKMFKDQ